MLKHDADSEKGDDALLTRYFQKLQAIELRLNNEAPSHL